MKNVTDTFGLGSDLYDCIKNAKAMEGGAQFEFNGVLIKAAPDSDEKLLARDYFRALQKKISSPVGPYPPAELSADALANDARIDAEIAERDRVMREEWERKDKAKRAALASEIVGAKFTLKDPEFWAQSKAKNQDAYGGAVLNYAFVWAMLMDVRMRRQNATVADVAKQASHDADTEGITGFMYGCAVSILSACWEHGEELRRWHNLDTQIGSEGEKANESGGVLNPALLNIGEADQ